MNILYICRPRFFWKITAAAGQRGVEQSAYQIRVTNGSNVVYWDTGIVNSSTTTQIQYKGAPLRSMERYTWTVVSWQGASPASPRAAASLGMAKAQSSFEMGLLHKADFTADWISGPNGDCNEFRSTVSIPGGSKIASARAYMSAIGYARLYVNGRRASEAVLEPSWTTFQVRNLYTTMDITDLLTVGNENVLALMAGT